MYENLSFYSMLPPLGRRGTTLNRFLSLKGSGPRLIVTCQLTFPEAFFGRAYPANHE